MKDLSERSKKFCECYIKNGYNAREAYKEAYDLDDPLKASSCAYRLLQDPRILKEIEFQQGTFRELGNKIGLTKELMVKTLYAMMNAVKTSKHGDEPDWTARHNAVMAFAKLTGDLVEKKVKEEKAPEIEEGDKIDVGKMDDKALMAKKKEILERMTFAK